MRVRPLPTRSAGPGASRPTSRLTAALLPAVLALSSAVPGAAAPSAGPDPADLPPGAVALADEKAPGAGRPGAGLEDGRYVVVLRDSAVATYDGGIGGLRATAVPDGARLRASGPDARAYRGYLAGRQQDVAQDVDVEPLASYTVTTNGFAADLTAEQASALLTDPRVSAVVPNEIVHVADEAGAAGTPGMATSTDYLGLSGDDGVWASVGGVEEAGAGVVVGVVDTGIAPENPSFAGEPLGTTPGDEPYLDGDTITYERSDGGTFRGRCVTGVQFDAGDCTTKVIGARYYVDGFGAANIGSEQVGEYLSPRDGGGHGSHTASTAAGTTGVEVTSPVPAVVSGVAPAARIAVYKACWSGADPQTDLDDGCATADLLAAIDDAVADGVDVINYSIGSSPGTTYSVVDQAFLAAAAAGVFVAAAGGNSGPDESTVDNLSPWITTVAATTYPSSDATVRTGAGDAFVGASVTVPEGGLTGPFVDAAAVGAAGADEPELCGPSTLDPEQVAGTIVLCRRGTVDRVAKSAEVARAGGIGMVLVNPETSSLDLDAHSVPTVHVDSTALAALTGYAASADATVTLEDGNTTGEATNPVPQVAGFSSRGPVTVDGGDLIKPDVAAPGVNVLAAGANPAGAAGVHVFMSGTSMASPHVAGLAALYLGERPAASVAEVKSALMTSAADTVDGDGAPAPDPAAQGNGQVVPAAYLRPGLLYLAGLDDWKAYVAGVGADDLGVPPVDPSDLNLPSVGIGGLAGSQTVTRTVTAAQAGTWTAAVTGMPGVDVTVEPATLVFGAAGEEQDVAITFTRRDAALGDVTSGYLTWSGEDVPSVRSALAVRSVALDVPAAVSGTGTTGDVRIAAGVGETATLPLTADGLARGEVTGGTGTVGGPTHRYAVDVPEGAVHARFALDAGDDTADLDLFLFRESEYGGLERVDQSATGSADEQVDVTAPAPGTYVVEVDFYAGGTRQPEALDYTLTSFVLDPAAEEGGFTTDPATLEGTLGARPVVTASWRDLAPGAYLGAVSFGDTGLRTLVTVDAGTAEPQEPGEPRLTVGPEWARAGGDLRVTATGLAGDVVHEVVVDGSATPLRTGAAAASGRLDWYVTLPGDLAEGDHTVTLRGPGTEVSERFRVSPVTVSSLWGYAVGAWDGRPRVELDASYSGAGTVRATIVNARTGETYLDTVDELPSNPWLPTLSYQSARVPAAAEPLVGTLTVRLADGSDGPSLTTELTPDPIEPSTVGLTPRADDPDRLEVTVDNRSGTALYPLVRYTLCDGGRIEATGYAPEGSNAETYDLTGVTRVELFADDEVVGTYENTDGPARCADAVPEVTQDLWAHLSAPEDPEDPERPVAYEVGFRHAAYSPGFWLEVGEGPERYAEDPFHSEGVPTEVVTEQGPVVTRSFTLPEATPAWAVATYEAQTPIIHYQGMAWLETGAVTVDELRPQEPGGPDPTPDPTPEPSDEPTPEPSTSPSAEPTDPGAEPTADPQPTEIAGPGKPGTGGSSDDPAGTADGPGGLAATGAEVALLITVALALLVLGTGAILLARYRRRRPAVD